MPNRTRVVIGIPTRNRPVMLRDCLESIGDLLIPDTVDCSIVVMQNGADCSAVRRLCRKIGIDIKIPVSCRVEPRVGIAHARNALIDYALSADADYLLFIDDDETVDRRCLARHVETALELHADIGGGCVAWELPEKAPKWASSIFLQPAARQNGPTGTGNCMISLGFVRNKSARFEQRVGQTGGSDTAFFQTYIDDNTVTYFDRGAVVFEPVRRCRLTLRYQFMRCVNTQAKHVARKSGEWSTRKKVRRWSRKIAVGCLVALPLFGVAWLFSRRTCIHHWHDFAYAIGTVAGLTGFRFARYRVTDGQ